MLSLFRSCSHVEVRVDSGIVQPLCSEDVLHYAENFSSSTWPASGETFDQKQKLRLGLSTGPIE